MNPNGRPIQRILVVGGRGLTHLGESFTRAAGNLGFQTQLVDVAIAYQGTWLWRKFQWHVRHGAPSSLGPFRSAFSAGIRELLPDLVLVTGIHPVSVDELKIAKANGARTVVFLSDDPYNPKYRSPRFFRVLSQYDIVFTPRTSNVEELRSDGGRNVVYLPFAFDPLYFFSETVESNDIRPDIVFVGGADRDRVPFMDALIRDGLTLELYGMYWERYEETKRFARGVAGPDLLRQATNRAKINFCLVRRANRDGHVMRTYEIAACGACLLAEDTPEHREILGDGAEYFDSPATGVRRAKELLADPDRRTEMGKRLQRRVRDTGNTYADRLRTILERTMSESTP